MKLRLYHHRDGTRIAYREAGVGPSLCLVHSAALSHREFVPLVEHLADRFRLVLPDLPVHGDSEDRPRHPYTLDWLAEVMAAFCRETCGAHPIVGGHGAGAEILLRAVSTGQLQPARLVLMPNRLHCPPARSRLAVPLRALAPAASLPGLDRAASRAVRLAYRPEHGMKLTARGNPAARDLVRHATADVAGNANLARSWSRWVRRWPAGRADRRCSTPTRASRRRSCCCGPTATATTRSPAPSRRWTCCPTRSCACCRARAFSSPTTTRSASRAS